MTLKRICNEFDIKCSSNNFISYISNSNFKNLDDIKIIISGNEKIISFYYNKINNE